MQSRMDVNDVDTNDKMEYEAARRSIRDKWLEILTRDSYFPDATTYENYQRLSLMCSDISDRFNGKSEGMKRKMVRAKQSRKPHHSQYANPPRHRRFITCPFSDVMDLAPERALDNRILTELSASSSLNPYDREAFKRHSTISKVKISSFSKELFLC